MSSAKKQKYAALKQFCGSRQCGFREWWVVFTQRGLSLMVCGLCHVIQWYPYT